jgi:hypothetical protein
MQPIHLSYTPDRADFAAVLATAPTPAGLRVVFIGSVLAMSGGLGWLSENNKLFAALAAWAPPWGDVVTVAAMVAVMYAVLIGLRRLSRAIRARRAAAAAGRIAVDADGDGVSVGEAGRLDVYPWAEVLAAWLSQDHVFIAAAGGRRIALPRRAFADDAAMAAFAVAAEERVAVESEREDAAASSAATPQAAR